MNKQIDFLKSGILRLVLILGCSLTLLSACNEKEKAPDITAGRPIMRILFIGNEYTSDSSMPYNMPAIVQALAQNDPSSHFKVEVGMHVSYGATLSKIWDTQDIKFLLISTKWDYVVLQPDNKWVASKSSIDLAREALDELNNHIRSSESRPVLFVPWALDENNASYNSIRYPNLKNHNNMHKILNAYSKSVAGKLKMPIVPVGDYWEQTINNKPEIHLYTLDGSTPTIEGSYLTAMIIYKTLVDTTLDDIEYTPYGISPETKADLISIASKKIQKPNTD